MAENYVESGYVESGYVEGESFTLPLAGGHPLKFFVSSGAKTVEEVKTDVANGLGQDEIAVIYAPEVQKIMLGTSSGFIEFLGGIDIQSIISDQTFIDAVKANAVVNMTASIVGSDGSVVSNATVTQTAPTTFEVTIPPELVGTSYNIVLDGGS